MSFVDIVTSQQDSWQGMEKIHKSSVKPERCTQTSNGMFSQIVYIKKKAKVR